MTRVVALLDKAETHFRSQRRLADAIGESQSFLSRIKRGESKLSPVIAGKLAEITGDDPREAALQALALAEQDESKRAELIKLFRLRIS